MNEIRSYKMYPVSVAVKRFGRKEKHKCLRRKAAAHAQLVIRKTARKKARYIKTADIERAAARFTRAVFIFVFILMLIRTERTCK